MDPASSQRAHKLARELGVSDAEIAAMIGVAEELLVANNLPWQGALAGFILLEANQGGPMLGIVYRIGVTPQQAASMGWTLAERLVNANLDRPGVFVDFLGTLIPT